MYLTSTGSSEEYSWSAGRQRHYRWIWNSRTPCSLLGNKIIKEKKSDLQFHLSGDSASCNSSEGSEFMCMF